MEEFNISIRLRYARLERPATDSWLTLYWAGVAGVFDDAFFSDGSSPFSLPQYEDAGLTDQQWDWVVENLYPGWELVCCAEEME